MTTRACTCPLCEAMCGLKLTVESGRIADLRGDPEDVLSRGYICPKALALPELQEDPGRLRQPVRRVGDGWQAIGWKQALDLAAERLAHIQRRHGRDSVAVYSGNPNLHSYAAQLTEPEFARAVGSRNRYSTASVDHLPHLFASYYMFGHQALLPIPDLDRTDHLLIVGANPVESNGSLLGAPGMAARLRAIRKRGGRLVVIDPRRTRSAELADRHHFIRPGTDALLLMCMVRTLFVEGLARPGGLAAFTDGIAALREASLAFTPERVAETTGVAADDLLDLARAFARARAAVCYGRVGSCTQEFGAVCSWLINALNVLTGNLDRPGGAMFPRPAVDIVALGTLLGAKGSHGRWRSRVRGLPEFDGQLPLATLADEISTAGAGQVRALITSAGNPVLSSPNGKRLEALLPSLEFMVAIDLYVNETTRHAHLILPTASMMERDHYDVVFRAFGIRNTARYTEPVIEPDPDALQEWQIYCRLGAGLARRRDGWRGAMVAARLRAIEWVTPRRILDLALRFGPHGNGFRLWRRGLSTAILASRGRTQDLGPLASCLPRRLATADRRIKVAPVPFVADVPRLRAKLGVGRPAGQLVLIGRRQLRNNNSWMHRFPSLRGPRNRCTLLMHPHDAGVRGLRDGQQVQLISRTGTLVVELEVAATIMPGVVSLPHGFGRAPDPSAAAVPERWRGVSLNDVTDELRLDPVSGTAAFSGVPVEVKGCNNPITSIKSCVTLDEGAGLPPP